MSGENVIHPTAVVEDGVTLGTGCVIHPYAVLRAGTVLADCVVVHSFSVIGGEPQDVHFNPSVASGVHIGAGTVIREQSTVNRATTPGGATVVGEKCFLMATSHVGHDSRLGDNVILANGTMLGGFTEIGDNCFLGGGMGTHQFSRIGPGVIVAGGARVTLNIPPFVMVAERNDVVGLNFVGLKRAGVPRETIRELKDAFRAVYFTPGNIRKVAAQALDTGSFKSAEARRFLEFFTTGKRGFARTRRQGVATDADEA
ncbi:MAG TPA: acyl-ACP--UDP-N-acetylglucosamine O-acyltransferase [Opitutaceae bacterium]|nr:acyl-ACP--UDP-N-acetylglucosamine O-acyltransferase [Opitutaceae bacterium]